MPKLNLRSSTISMAGEAAAADICDSLVIMFLDGLGLVMTLETINVDFRPCMAIGTHTVRATMIHREGVARYVDITPVTGSVALQALPTPVVCWPCVAGLAVCQP